MKEIDELQAALETVSYSESCQCERCSRIVAALALLPGLREKFEALSHQMEADRTKVAECLTQANKAIDGRDWLTEGRGPYEWNDDRWHSEFYAAAVEIKDAMAPMTAIAANWKDCPMSAEEIAVARQDLKQRAEAAESQLAEKDARIAGLEKALLGVRAELWNIHERVDRGARENAMACIGLAYSVIDCALVAPESGKSE